MKKQIKNALPVVQNPSLVAVRGSNDETSLSQYIQNIQKFPILSAEQEYEYAKKWTKTHVQITPKTPCTARYGRKLITKKQPLLSKNIRVILSPARWQF